VLTRGGQSLILDHYLEVLARKPGGGARRLASPKHAMARGATLRRQIVTVPARFAQPQRRRVLHLPGHWSWKDPWTALWTAVFATGPPATA
jgi:hypothetical protein